MDDVSGVLLIDLLVNIFFKCNFVLVMIKHDFLLLLVPADGLQRRVWYSESLQLLNAMVFIRH